MKPNEERYEQARREVSLATVAELIADQDRRLIARAGDLLALRNGRIVRVKIKPKAAESS
jgi:urease accessory protein UreE